MESPKEHMKIIQEMCRMEINLLKNNLDKLLHDSVRCQKLLGELISEDVTNIFGLIGFDRYMTQMVTALNMARKYNIHLQINNLDQTVINASSNGCFDDAYFTQTRVLKDFIEWRKTCLENDMGWDVESNIFGGRIKMSEQITTKSKTYGVGSGQSRIKSLEPKKNNTKKECATVKEDDLSKKIESLLNILLPAKCLQNFRKGFDFEACIVHVGNYKKCEFFVCLGDDYKTFFDMSFNINFKPISREDLPLNDVFCVLENGDDAEKKCLWRAIIVPDEKYYVSEKLIYLVDFGEVIPLTDNCQTYLAPLHYKEIPPLAIKCVLEGIKDSSFECIYDPNKCRQALQKNEFEKTNFRVVYQKSGILHVLMWEKPISAESNFASKNKETNPFINTIFDDSEQNSSTVSDVLQLPRSVVYDASPIDPVLNLPYKIGDHIQIIVTHIVSPICFYGIIQNERCDDTKAFSWNDCQICPLQKEMSARPQLNSLVLSKYSKDRYWYRAKLINIDAEKELYTVFYVDFGNTEIVSLSCLAKCSEEQLKDPLRAVRFYLSNLCLISDDQIVQSSGKIRLKSVIENVVVMILDQIINVEIADRRNDDLIVRLVDSQYAAIPKMLLDMGVVKET